MNANPDRVILVNKPLEWTSFDVVNKLRFRLKIKKIGHAGTLDPLATGLLILCTGKMTRQIEEFQNQEKEYTGVFCIGQTTPSHDLETSLTDPVDVSHLQATDIYGTALNFIGNIQQVPPIHSAIKVEGKRSYKLARRGISLELKPREVVVHEFEITSIQGNSIGFRIVCSKGTYIRSLVRDFGEQLKVGAYLKTLCRTRIGVYKLDQALLIDEIQ